MINMLTTAQVVKNIKEHSVSLTSIMSGSLVVYITRRLLLKPESDGGTLCNWGPIRILCTAILKCSVAFGAP